MDAETADATHGYETGETFDPSPELDADDPGAYSYRDGGVATPRDAVVDVYRDMHGSDWVDGFLGDLLAYRIEQLQDW